MNENRNYDRAVIVEKLFADGMSDESILLDAGFFESEIVAGVDADYLRMAKDGFIWYNGDFRPCTARMVQIKQQNLDYHERAYRVAIERLERRPECIGTTEAGEYVGSDTRCATRTAVFARLRETIRDAQFGRQRFERQYHRTLAAADREAALEEARRFRSISERMKCVDCGGLGLIQKIEAGCTVERVCQECGGYGDVEVIMRRG